ncbi:MAG: ferritin family protein [Candidatus Pacebacteria bacterium]|nr:ferritin family protein [Candidatus Paceibacterota bacterium]MDR3583473.1 ferritin family protein [Candidatus Paceibacterota bacterium]
MKVYICEICGDAYIGTEKPHDCPFCGAKDNFIKLGSEAKPIVNEKIEISELSKKNLLETLKLETEANAIYLCMAGHAATYEIKAMYKRIAKVELEHAAIVTKLLGMQMPEINPETCADVDADNFKRTIELEDHAVELYKKFAREAEEDNIRKFFGAIMQAEAGHAELIKSYL